MTIDTIKHPTPNYPNPREIKGALRVELKRAISAELYEATFTIRETWNGDGCDIIGEGDVYWRRGEEYGAHYYSARVSHRTNGGIAVGLSGGWYGFTGADEVRKERPRRFGRIVFSGAL